MSRSKRLLDLIHLLRSYRYPVKGAQLAETLGISLRTLYRDIASLQEQGASIEGEPGVGYVLKPGFMLPPLMFTEEELEALVLGSRWVASRTDSKLNDSAKSAITKIQSVLPDNLRESLIDNTLMVVPSKEQPDETMDLSEIREAMRQERKVTIAYRDLKGQASDRIIWPFALAYFDHVKILVAWCELRQSFRHFRTDKIVSLTVEQTRYPRYRQALLKEWRIEQNIPPENIE
ncbi:helix-turn-helix transcriptional regulator [Leucothrix arctica]|uniref:Transcriptional regulator n=1 Tax=Leucothrix arctica TaxID=1481894 RepID=A0A317CN78_9GAMM|nr:YafY family protein [Leucothrix arctica]PWQ97770.1 transcriptional regulator [Leucothrix arctica]